MTWRGVVMLAGILTALCVASPVARRVAWAVARALGHVVISVVALVVIAVRDRQAARTRLAMGTTTPRRPVPPVRPRPAPEPARPLTTWHVLAELVDDRGQRWRLTSGAVTGPWRTAAEVQAAGIAQWHAARGPLPHGRLALRVTPVTAEAAPERQAAS